MPDAILIAGANGSGKTSFARELIRLEYPNATFLNADEIQREEEAYAELPAAGRELIRRMEAAVAVRADFSVETTLSSLFYARRISSWRSAGYFLTLHFIEIVSADLAVARVAQRVAHGGHHVPEPDIRRRHARGLRLVESHYKLLSDHWYHYMMDQDGLRLIDEKPRP